MRQHPIPQNVLDVEFKLFTKFTLKEFAYLAAGIGIGAIFLVLNNKAGLPGIIAWPAFITLSCVGAFFALVPINDQSADEFVKNYFTAINKPTQRVWLSKQMQEERIKPVVKSNDSKKNKIIGGSGTASIKTFEERPGDDVLTTRDQTQSEPKLIQNQIEQTTISSNGFVIGPQNISQYQFSIQSVDRLPGNINIWVADMNNRGIPNIPVYLKDQDGKVIFASRTGPNGYFLTNQILPKGVYYIQFDQSVYRINNITWILESNQTKNPIKLTANLI